MEYLIAALFIAGTWFLVDSTVIHPKPSAIHYYAPSEPPKNDMEKAIRLRDQYVSTMEKQGEKFTDEKKESLLQYFIKMVEDEEKRFDAPTKNIR